LLLERLDAIGESLDQSEHALALIGLGSVGLELGRLDAYSDLDFFVIVEPGYKQHYMNDLHWLNTLCPIAYSFANTKDGYKVLFADGIFCEFAILEPDELGAIPFAPGRIVWKRPDASPALGQPAVTHVSPPKHDLDWLLGETLTNLLVGLSREKRGEKLSGFRLIQGYAVERALELADYVEVAQEADQDPFANERRFEQRYPGIAGQVSAWLPGYDGNRESALAILAFLEQHFKVNTDIADAIKELCA
jgi:hypothetical protein